MSKTQTEVTLETPEIPQVISINGVDYDPTEAQSLIEFGKKSKDYETQYGMPLDQLGSEYGKTRQSLEQIQKERDDAKKQLEQFQSKQNAGTETQADVQKAREAARQLGLTLNEDLEKSGYIKKDEVHQMFQSWQQEQDAVKKVLSEADQLEKELNGEDGRPKFVKKVVLPYASAYGIPDLKAAWEDMNKESLDSWKSTQIESQRKPGLKTLSSGSSSKEPKQTKVTDDNVKNLLRESLYGEEE